LSERTARTDIRYECMKNTRANATAKDDIYKFFISGRRFSTRANNVAPNGLQRVRDISCVFETFRQTRTTQRPKPCKRELRVPEKRTRDNKSD